MNKISVRSSVGIVLSVLWLIYQFVKHYQQWMSTEYYFHLVDVVDAIIPLVIFWGLVWIIFGFMNKDNNTEDTEDDK